MQVKSCFQSIKLAIIPGLMEPKWEIFKVILASMNQTMPNSQETVLKIKIDRGYSVDKAANANLPLLSLLLQSILLEHQVQIL